MVFDAITTMEPAQVPAKRHRCAPYGHLDRTGTGVYLGTQQRCVGSMRIFDIRQPTGERHVIGNGKVRAANIQGCIPYTHVSQHGTERQHWLAWVPDCASGYCAPQAAGEHDDVRRTTTRQRVQHRTALVHCLLGSEDAMPLLGKHACNVSRGSSSRYAAHTEGDADALFYVMRGEVLCRASFALCRN